MAEINLLLKAENCAAVGEVEATKSTQSDVEDKEIKSPTKEGLLK